ncbi:uncharacterized protein GGS22DRAFT_182660 [Annulohypoxylon maeteangense]|uniref:uncharacterized protein n=1 Tax=Annulohypoxylon maeteangense TaxID=1927788 RepID=UPI002007EA6E|nr:uncharacterized protein GGS22DRAFT_182660 [Annulohypoxylon maeteangense]KAI0880029.1 hypothetical protein GGS22DRAFT_182660 [Annulohypoxylon maeteangense]
MHANLRNQISLLRKLPERDDLDEIMSAPLFTYPVLKSAERLTTIASKAPFAQYALLAGDADMLQRTPKDDPRIFYNVAVPSSTFICGSQGSGKSHSLSCILENCLIPAPILGHLPKPLAGIVFHYDTFISDAGGVPCEAAYISSDPRVKVRVLCPPTNFATMKDTYSSLKNVKVEELRLKESYLNTKRMLELMAFSEGGRQPLYLHVIQRILRDMRVAQQQTKSGFKYSDFIKELQKENLLTDQIRPLLQRLNTLESFMVPEEIGTGAQIISQKPKPQKKVSKKASKKANKKAKSGGGDTQPSDTDEGTNWTLQSGELLIVDLSCPCITPSMACSLFNICLSIFLEQKTSLGRVIALDEAHKYMDETVECETLTNNLLSAIRLQRHLGARVIVSTQEPTISPKLLDLCSITVVHRFTSPDWLNMLKKHIAGIPRASKMDKIGDIQQDVDRKGGADVPRSMHEIVAASSDPYTELFSHIVELRTGEAFVFAPSAIIDFGKRNSQLKKIESTRLAHRIMRVIMRARITTDGGRSIMAT